MEFNLEMFTGEGQFGKVWKAIAEGICPNDANRTIVAVKTLKGQCSIYVRTIIRVCPT